MNYKKMVDKINTAGAWFAGSFMLEFLVRYDEWNGDVDKRVDFIKSIHSEYGEANDYDIETTKTKCYALMAIINEGKVEDALMYVLETNDNKIVEGAKENARETLIAIDEGRIKLPY